MPHIMFLVWILNEDKGIRNRALLCMTTLVNPSEDYSNFYEQVATGSTGADIVVLRELARALGFVRRIYSFLGMPGMKGGRQPAVVERWLPERARSTAEV